MPQCDSNWNLGMTSGKRQDIAKSRKICKHEIHAFSRLVSSINDLCPYFHEISRFPGFLFFFEIQKKEKFENKVEIHKFHELAHDKFMKFHEIHEISWKFTKFMKFMWNFMNFLKFHEISWISWILLKFHEFHEFREFSCNFMNFVNFQKNSWIFMKFHEVCEFSWNSWISWIFMKFHEFREFSGNVMNFIKFPEFREFCWNFMNFVNFRAISWISWLSWNYIMQSWNYMSSVNFQEISCAISWNFMNFVTFVEIYNEIMELHEFRQFSGNFMKFMRLHLTKKMIFVFEIDILAVGRNWDGDSLLWLIEQLIACVPTGAEFLQLVGIEMWVHCCCMWLKERLTACEL